MKDSLKSLQKFRVTITETLKMSVEVEASDRYEAAEIISDGWHDSEYVLNADNFSKVAFEAVPVDDV